MLAIFKTGGKQYSVKAGQILKVEKLSGKKGDDISFKDNDNSPDAVTGWSPERSMRLGEASLVAMLAVVDDLR